MGAKNKKRQEEYDKFVEYVETMGIWNLSVVKYAELTGIPMQTISRWKQDYIKAADFNPKEFGREFQGQGLATLKKMGRIAAGKDTGNALKAGKYLIECAEKYVAVLEKLGIITTEGPEPSLQIAATDKDLYGMLTPTQKKKLARIAEDA